MQSFRDRDPQSWLETLPLGIALACSKLYLNGTVGPETLDEMKDLIRARIIEPFGGEPQQAIWGLLLLEAELKRIPQVQPKPFALDQQRQRIPKLISNIARRLPIAFIADRSPAHVWSFSITVTSQGLTVEGPFWHLSNRVIRQHRDHMHNFLRARFHIDGNTIESANEISSHLRSGIRIAGRTFEFLAYSMSSLKSHTVWMFAPYESDEGLVTSDTIRGGLGDFHTVEQSPARYGARVAQAFTATIPAIRLEPDQLCVLQDHKAGNFLFTDGVGTISPAIAYRVVECLKDTSTPVFPALTWAFQIRIGGFKGVVMIDTKRTDRKLFVRPSMLKFESNHLELEIVKVFAKPSVFFLNRPLIMLLESRGIHRDVFLSLQEAVIQQANRMSSSYSEAAHLMELYALGRPFHLSEIFASLHQLLNLDSNLYGGASCIRQEPFLSELIEASEERIFRTLEYKARIPVPQSWTLVGVSDELEGLYENQVCVCIRESSKATGHWLEGPVLLARSPCISPGSVHVVIAKGRPPSDRRYPVNCLVFPRQGIRPLQSMLSGGDLDGDLYHVISYEALLPERWEDPDISPDIRDVPGSGIEEPGTFHEVAEFASQYMCNDLMGRLATRHLIMADLSRRGVYDRRCKDLVHLYNIAVDTGKTGYFIDHKSIPPLPTHRRPHYMNPDGTFDTYHSKKALGHLFDQIVSLRDSRRNPNLIPLSARNPHAPTLDTLVSRFLGQHNLDIITPHVLPVFDRYMRVLGYLLSSITGAERDLTEVEAVLGIIHGRLGGDGQAKKAQFQLLKEQMSFVVEEVRRDMEGCRGDTGDEKLRRAAEAWSFARRQGDAFGARSFSLIALGLIFQHGGVGQERE